MPRAAALLAVSIAWRSALAERTEDFLDGAGHLEVGGFFDEIQETEASQRHETAVASGEDPCKYAETWSDWSTGDEDCVRDRCERSLRSRKVAKFDESKGGECAKCQKSKLGGWDCPPHEDNRDRRPCCPEETRDCSTVDINNRVDRPGVVMDGSYEKMLGDDKECTLQLWQVEKTDTRWYFRLLGETRPDDKRRVHARCFYPVQNGWDERSLTAKDREVKGAILFNEGSGEISPSSVALGFRGCFVKPEKEKKDPLYATICNWDDQAFKLDRNSNAFTKEMDYMSTHYEIHGVDNGDHRKGFALSVVTRVWRPDPPVIASYEARGSSIELRLADQYPRDYGARISYRAAVRKVFKEELGSKCGFKDLPECTSSSSTEPCFESNYVTLKNLVLAATFEVRLWAVNAVVTREGSQVEAAPPGTITVHTNVKSGSSSSANCVVDYWTCTPDKESKDVGPEENSPACDPGTPPLPICEMKSQKGILGGEKCNKKKYIRKCKPTMVTGDPSCVDAKSTVCEYASKAADCQDAGCGKSAFGTKYTCCCADVWSMGPSRSEAQANCACVESDKCPKNSGVFTAGNAATSCRH